MQFIMLIHKITNSLDHGDIVISIFLDLKKAFDTVDHRILLNKLYAYGIHGNVRDWFRSYLMDRSQFVIYDRERSDTKHIKSWCTTRINSRSNLIHNIYE